jgi:hypothetical protein
LNKNISQKINRSVQYFENFPTLKNYKPELNMSKYINGDGRHKIDKIESIARSPYLNQGNQLLLLFMQQT